MTQYHDTKTAVTDREIFGFAKSILAVLALIFLASFLLSVFVDSPVAATVWDKVSTVIPPLASLIIGRYFGRR